MFNFQGTHAGPASAATAYLDYHALLILSTTFFSFFKIFFTGAIAPSARVHVPCSGVSARFSVRSHATAWLI